MIGLMIFILNGFLKQKYGLQTHSYHHKNEDSTTKKNARHDYLKEPSVDINQYPEITEITSNEQSN